MHRRSFLASIGALALAPSIPISGAQFAPAHVATYNRYMYGLGVFHARHKSMISAIELSNVMHISPLQAEIMMNEMLSNGVIAPFANSLGMMRAIDPMNSPKYIPKVVMNAIPKTNVGKVELNNFPLESNNSASLHTQSPRKNLANDKDCAPEMLEVKQTLEETQYSPLEFEEKQDIEPEK